VRYRVVRSASRAFLDPGGEEAGDLGDAGGAEVGPAGGGVDPAEVGLAVELGEGVEERARGGVGGQGGGDVVGEVAALRAFRNSWEPMAFIVARWRGWRDGRGRTGGPRS
jgi:hypothetical protein